MKTLKFNKTECGVDFLLNVLHSKDIRNDYFNSDYSSADFFEIFFFKKASGQLFLNHKKSEILDNSIVFISPLQKKSWNVNFEDLDFTLLVFQEDFLNDFFSDKLFTYKLQFFYQSEFPLIVNNNSEIIDRYCILLSEIKEEILKTKADSIHIIRSLIYYLLQKLNREYAEKHHLSFKKNDSNYAFQFKKLIEIHFRKKQRINDYTEILGVSRIMLNKAVKEQFNVTATDLLKQRLLIEIKDYLVYTDLTIAEIAYELHFSQPNHLMRFFKSQTGMTTSEFLIGYQNGISY